MTEITLKIGESVKIGDDLLSVKIVAIQCNSQHFKHKYRALIGLAAPKNLSIHREEVYDKIKNKVKNER